MVESCGKASRRVAMVSIPYFCISRDVLDHFMEYTSCSSALEQASKERTGDVPLAATCSQIDLRFQWKQTGHSKCLLIGPAVLAAAFLATLFVVFFVGCGKEEVHNEQFDGEETDKINPLSTYSKVFVAIDV